MSRTTDSHGATQGAMVVIFGMILGAMLLLVVQRYAKIRVQVDLAKLIQVYEGQKS